MKSPLTQKQQTPNPRARMTKAQRIADTLEKRNMLEQILDDIELPANSQDVAAEERGREIQIVRSLKQTQRATEREANVGLHFRHRGWKQTEGEDFSTTIRHDNHETMTKILPEGTCTECCMPS